MRAFISESLCMLIFAALSMLAAWSLVDFGVKLIEKYAR